MTATCKGYAKTSCLTLIRIELTSHSAKYVPTMLTSGRASPEEGSRRRCFPAWPPIPGRPFPPPTSLARVAPLERRSRLRPPDRVNVSNVREMAIARGSKTDFGEDRTLPSLVSRRCAETL